MSIPVGDGGTLVNVAPVLAGSKALLGEANKVAAVSTFRFSSVAASADGGTLVVGLRGKPGEVVHLLFASAAVVSSKVQERARGANSTSFVCKGTSPHSSV